MTLKKEISTLNLLFIATGSMIGSGWLLGPYFSAKVAGAGAILSWLIGGLLMMIVGFTFAELSALFPEAGSLIRFAKYSHGTFASFNIAWILWLAAVMVAPIETMATIQYASNYLPCLAHQKMGTTTLTNWGVGAATVLMLVMCFINQFSIRYFAKSNFWVVAWKLLVPTATICLLFHHHFDIKNFTDFNGFISQGWQGVFKALSTTGIVASFIGYTSAVQLAGEVTNPKRAMVVAIVGSISIAIVIYVLLESAFIGAIPSANLKNGFHLLHFTKDAGPIAGIITAYGITWFLPLIYTDSLISPLGTGYIYTTTTARINLAMSKNGYMPQWMQKLNRHGSPYRAIAFNFVFGMIFFLPFPGWQSMVSFIASCFILAYAMGPIACANLRRRMPKVQRTFKVPIYWPFCLVAFYICNLIIFWAGWQVIWKMFTTLLIGYIVLFIRVYRRETLSLELMRGLWMIPYFIGIAVISYLSTFGDGLGIMPFGVDFVVIAIFSIIIYIIALLESNQPKLRKCIWENTTTNESS